MPKNLSKQIRTFTLKYRIAFLVIVILFGALLRLSSINSTDLWYDEAFTGLSIEGSWQELFATLKTDKIHPPLYSIVLKLWTELTWNSPLTLRLFSAFFGVVTIPIIYLFSKELTKSDEFSLISATLIAASPFYITYSNEARSYAFLTFIGVLSAYAFLKSINTKTINTRAFWIFILFLTLISLLYTHYMSLLIIVGYATFLAVNYLHKKRLLDKFKLQIAICTCAILLTGLYLSKIPSIQSLINSANLGWIPKANLTDIVRSISAFLFGVNRQALGVPPFNNFPLLESVNLALLVFVAIIILYPQASTKNGKSTLFLTSLSIVPLTFNIYLSFCGLHAYVERYLSIYGVFLILLIAYIFWQVIKSKIFSYTLLILYLILLTQLNYPQPLRKYSNITKYIQNKKENIVIISDPLDFVVLKYYNVQICKTSNRCKQLFLFTPSADSDYSGWAMINPSDKLKNLENIESDYMLLTRSSNPECEKKIEDYCETRK